MKAHDEDELEKELKSGWRIYRTSDSDFYVTHKEKDAYLDSDGGVCEQAVYFNDPMEANTAFSEFLKNKKEETDEEDELRTEEDYQTDWGSSEVERKIDGFWYLTYEESQPMGEERRWAVFSPDSDFHVGPDGVLTRKPFWFDSEDEALEAYEKHLDRAEGIGSLRKLLLSVVYTVFILPIKAAEMLIYALMLPAKVTWMLTSTQASVFGFTKGGRVPYVAKGLVLLFVAAFAFWVHTLLGVIVLLYIVSAAVYWGSPYQPYGSMVNPRWIRRDEEIVTSEPSMSHEEQSDFEPTTSTRPSTRPSRADSESEPYDEPELEDES